MLKKLNHCRAHYTVNYIDNAKPCTEYVLYSYSTKVARILEYKNGVTAVFIYRYNSNTTAQHLRKFERLLFETGLTETYILYRDLLDIGVKYKGRLCFTYALKGNAYTYKTRYYTQADYNKMFTPNNIDMYKILSISF